MISHFTLSGSDNSFYFAISKIQQEPGEIYLSGILGDGSAEAWFEARVGQQLTVKILPIWDAGSEALCQRYDQTLLEQALSGCFENIRFHSDLIFDRVTDCWTQQVRAEMKTPSPVSQPGRRNERPHAYSDRIRPPIPTQSGSPLLIQSGPPVPT